MAVDPSKRADEIGAIRLGIDLGMSLIDTAEIYTNGRAEELIAEAVGNRRKEVFLVSKVMPLHATRQGTIQACESSLRRLKTDYLDCYLLHWRGSVPLEETLEAFQALKHKGKILDYGVSNFDVSDMEEAEKLPGGDKIATNQVLYNLIARGIERKLLPFCQSSHIPIMAYSPFGHDAKLLEHPVLKSIAVRHSATSAQVALAWVLRQTGVIVIPKASTTAHIKQNHAALELQLTHDDLTALDKAFPLPSKNSPLELL